METDSDESSVNLSLASSSSDGAEILYNQTVEQKAALTKKMSTKKTQITTKPRVIDYKATLKVDYTV